MDKAFIYIILFMVFQSLLFCDKEMIYIYNGPESSRDVRYLYQWEILKTALEKTKSKYGNYKMISSEPMTEERQKSELIKNSGKLTVMYLDTTPELEKSLIPIRIPVDKNLVGYRVFLIREHDKDKFADISTIDDLKKFSYGLGLGWIDVNIMEYNNFKVVTGSRYEGLFEMLINKRFDIFLRSAVEIGDEYEMRKKEMPELCIEDHILLYYPLPMYFWFAKTKAGEALAARVREGMLKMIDDGTYDKIFLKYHSEKIEKLKLNKRKLFKISNPYLVPETPFEDKRLWYTPLKN